MFQSHDIRELFQANGTGADMSQAKQGSPNPIGIPLLIVWAVVAGVAGGYACGLAIDRYGEIGSISLWALGALAGYVGRRIVAAQSQLAGSILLVACVLALVIAETCWIRWNLTQGAESWWAAFKMLPEFVPKYEIATLVATIFTGFGAWSAYRQMN